MSFYWRRWTRTSEKRMKPHFCINTGKTSSQEHGDPTLLLLLLSGWRFQTFVKLLFFFFDWRWRITYRRINWKDGLSLLHRKSPPQLQETFQTVRRSFLRRKAKLILVVHGLNPGLEKSPENTPNQAKAVSSPVHFNPSFTYRSAEFFINLL